MKKLSLLVVIVLNFAVVGSTQTSSPTPSTESLQAQEERLRAELRLLEAEVKIMNTIKAAAGSSNISAATSGGSTSFAVGQAPNMETVSLSYEAVREISQQIDRGLKPFVSNYRSLVIYHEPDFLALARYRLYREQVKMALANYEEIVKRIEEERSTASTSRPQSVRRMLGGGVMALSAPSIATSAIKSVAELASLFRTEQVITQSKDVVDKDSLGAVVAGTFLKANPHLTVYYPEQFVPEYEIGIADENSLYSMLARLNAAEAYLNYFLDQTEKLPNVERESPPLDRIIAAAQVVQKQIANLGFSYPSERDASDKGALRISEFRQMMRAEKLERALNPSTGKVGIMKLRLLSSGGARREKRNLLLGARTDYSGSAVVEVALYDADGTMRVNEIFSYHTGFRKFKTGDGPRL